jgi:ABC-2 type transport system permease protein
VIVARRFLRDRRRGFLWWSVGVVGTVLFSVAFFPSIRGNADFDRLVQDLPEAMRTLFGIDEQISLGTAPGYLHSRLFSLLLPILLVMYAIGTGAQAIAGSEDDGTLELLLANPVSRARVVGERIAAALLLVVGLAVVTAVATFALSPPFGALEGVDLLGLLAASSALTGLAVLHGALALGAGAAIGGRARVSAAAAIVAVGGYLVNGLFAVSASLDGARIVSPWHWYLRQNMLLDGPVWWPSLLPLVVAAAVLAAGVPLFLRRDLR